MEKYYGSKKVESVEWNVATLEWWEIVNLTDRQLEYVFTTEALSDTEFRGLCLSKVTSDMFDVMDAHNIKKDDFQAMLTTLTGSYNFNFQKAVAKQFGTFNPELPIESCVGNIRMSDISNILKQDI